LPASGLIAKVCSECGSAESRQLSNSVHLDQLNASQRTAAALIPSAEQYSNRRRGFVLLLHLETIFAGSFAFEVTFNVFHSVQL
jgi:hypothetical protein